MVDWKSPAEEAKISSAFENLIFVFFGLYVWEILQTSGMERSILSRRRRLVWPMSAYSNALINDLYLSCNPAFFFLARYCLLFALIGLIISFNPPHKINCQALYRFNSWAGNMAFLSASTSLMIRTIVLWEKKKYIMFPLLTACIVFWGLLLHGVIIVKSYWDDEAKVCAIEETNSTILTVNFFYTMGFDLVIFVLTSIALLKNPNRSSLWNLLFHDGLVFWGVTFTVNMIPAILNTLDLDPSMNVVGAIPAASVSVIAANRCVLRLMKFKTEEWYTHSNGGGLSVQQDFGVGTISNRFPRFARIRPEVTILTDHITTESFVPELNTTSNTSGIQSYIDRHRSNHDLESGSSVEDESKITGQLERDITDDESRDEKAHQA